MTLPSPAPSIRRITAAATRPLRQAILRPHQRAEQLVYPGDDDPASIHLGAFVDELLISIATIVPQPMPDDPRPGDWQLRGMATLPDCRGTGVGGALLEEGVRLVTAAGGRRIWCHGRVPAADFYIRHDFLRQGELYEFPGTGPHYLMTRTLG